MRQLLSTSNTDHNVMIEWLFIIHKLIIGIGASCAEICEMFSDKEDDNEARDMVVQVLTLLWIFNIVIVVKETDSFKAYTIGFGLKPLTPMLSIGMVK